MAVYQRCIKLCINVEMRYVVRIALYQRLLVFMNVTKLEKVTFDIRCYAIANAELLSPPQAGMCISANLTEYQSPYQKITLTFAD